MPAETKMVEPEGSEYLLRESILLTINRCCIGSPHWLGCRYVVLVLIALGVGSLIILCLLCCLLPDELAFLTGMGPKPGEKQPKRGSKAAKAK